MEARTAGPDPMGSGIVALRAAGLGDLLTAVPALRALAAQAGHDRAPLVVAAPAWLHPVVSLIPGVRFAVEVDGLQPRSPMRPALAVNLHGSGPQSHRALQRLQPRRMLAFRCSGVWHAGPQWGATEPERERWCRLLRWSGIPADPLQLEIERPVEAPLVRGAVILHLGASDRMRRWPASRFAELATVLRDHPVVLTGTRADSAGAAEVVRRARLDPGQSFAGRLSLAQLAATVAAARLVISGDTGVAHLAAAYRTPSVVVFGPESPLRWGPPPGPHRVVRAPGPAPWARQTPSRQVLAAVAGLLGSR